MLLPSASVTLSSNSSGWPSRLTAFERDLVACLRHRSGPSLSTRADVVSVLQPSIPARRRVAPTFLPSTTNSVCGLLQLAFVNVPSMEIVFSGSNCDCEWCA
jgi:hypothetical protein